MMSQAGRTGSVEGRKRLEDFLKRHFGENLSHPKMGPIAVREELTEDYEAAEYFAVNTVKAIESGNPLDGLMSGGIVVPKDGSAVHWAPTAVPVADYLEQVATGERWWSNAGADPVTEVRYYARLNAGRTRENPSGVMRRRTTEGRTVDEVFTRNVKWEPTEHFRRYDLGHDDVEHVEITAKEAADFVRRMRAKHL